MLSIDVVVAVFFVVSNDDVEVDVDGGGIPSSSCDTDIFKQFIVCSVSFTNVEDVVDVAVTIPFEVDDVVGVCVSIPMMREVSIWSIDPVKRERAL